MRGPSFASYVSFCTSPIRLSTMCWCSVVWLLCVLSSEACPTLVQRFTRPIGCPLTAKLLITTCPFMVMLLMISCPLAGGVAVNLSEWFVSWHLSNSPFVRLIAVAPTSLLSLLQEAGVQDPIIEYIWNLEITTVALFSRVGIFEPRFVNASPNRTSPRYLICPFRYLFECSPRPLSCQRGTTQSKYVLRMPHLFQTRSSRPRAQFQPLHTRPTTACCPLHFAQASGSSKWRSTKPVGPLWRTLLVKMLLGADGISPCARAI